MSIPYVGRHRVASRRRTIDLRYRASRHRKPTAPGLRHRTVVGLHRGLASILRSLR